MVRALLALGGNLGDVRRTFDAAIARLCDGRTVVLVARSSDYRTPPWGFEDQPPFVNCAIAADTTLTAHELLARMHEVERDFGRVRSADSRYGPRTLDIDLIAYGDAAIATPDLVVPHPRLFERAFVLVPLSEIAPDARISGIRVADAAAAADASGIERLPARQR